MKKLLLYLGILALCSSFLSCQGSKNIATNGYTPPTELTIEQLKKFALVEGVNWENLIFIDETSGLVIMGGHVTHSADLRFVVRNSDKYTTQNSSTIEKVAKHIFSDEKKSITILVVRQ